MKAGFQIELMENEIFYRFRWTKGRGTRIPGSETKAYRICLLSEGPGEETWIYVRRDTRASAVSATKQLLGLSTKEWSKMLGRYRTKQKRIRERVRRARRIKEARVAARAKRL